MACRPAAAAWTSSAPTSSCARAARWPITCSRSSSSIPASRRSASRSAEVQRRELFQHRGQQLADGRVNAHMALEFAVRHARVHGIEERVHSLVGPGPKQRGAENAAGLLLDVDLEKAIGLSLL